jgi:hypothetical protein
MDYDAVLHILMIDNKKICLNLLSLLIATFFIVLILKYCRSNDLIQGEYYSNGFTNIGDPANSKAYRIGGFKYNNSKKNTNPKKNIKEEIICSSCGISLMMSS